MVYYLSIIFLMCLTNKTWVGKTQYIHIYVQCIIYSDMSGYYGYYAKWNKPVPEAQTLLKFFWSKAFKLGKDRKVDNRTVASLGSAKDDGNYCARTANYSSQLQHYSYPVSHNQRSAMQHGACNKVSCTGNMKSYTHTQASFIPYLSLLLCQRKLLLYIWPDNFPKTRNHCWDSYRSSSFPNSTGSCCLSKRKTNVGGNQSRTKASGAQWCSRGQLSMPTGMASLSLRPSPSLLKPWPHLQVGGAALPTHFWTGWETTNGEPLTHRFLPNKEGAGKT